MRNGYRSVISDVEDVQRPSPTRWSHGIIGRSRSLQAVLTTVLSLTETRSTVLLTGESGTGKELIARALHLGSSRSDGPFIAINCAAIPESLIESELFGHEKGAFTHALMQRVGLCEQAHEGTLFLDEIGDLTPSAQCKLLRFLQEREFTRVGGTQPIRVDVRIVAATNKNLEELVRDKAFREDLYYRINVVSLYLPALRDRREDIPLLAEHFLTRRLREENRPPQRFSKEALQILSQYQWPGNVRELENVVERAMIWARGSMILPEHLPPMLRADSQAESLREETLAGRLSLEQAVRHFERETILDALKRTNFVQTQASALLGISRRMLKYRMDILGITRDLAIGTDRAPLADDTADDAADDTPEPETASGS